LTSALTQPAALSSPFDQGLNRRQGFPPQPRHIEKSHRKTPKQQRIAPDPRREMGSTAQNDIFAEI
jgi:hypothetical protein